MHPKSTEITKMQKINPKGAVLLDVVFLYILMHLTPSISYSFFQSLAVDARNANEQLPFPAPVLYFT